MNTTPIQASVGKGGRNLPTDVRTIQSLLAAKGERVGAVDGLCGVRTIDAITKYQSKFLRAPDGRVDPGGLTWRRLTSSISLTTLVAVPRDVNRGLVSPDNAFMVQKLGQPRSSYSQEYQPVTDPLLKRNMITACVGRFSATGLAPALTSLNEVMADINRSYPEVYAALGTAGMLCCRYQRGSTSRISNHSWGTAIDLTLNGILDVRGDGRVQHGLSLIAPLFNARGWYWGATFPTEDGMHFEAGRNLIEAWVGRLK